MTEYLKYNELKHSYRNTTVEQRRLLGEKALADCREKVKVLTNDELFADYSSLLAGDDWEGDFTHGGQMAMQALDEEITSRLVAIGFLKGEDHVNA